MDVQRNLTAYLRANGWESLRGPGPGGCLWDHKELELSVAILSVVTEGSLDWRSITTRLAEVEGPQLMPLSWLSDSCPLMSLAFEQQMT
jgi:hypothetical protein